MYNNVLSKNTIENVNYLRFNWKEEEIVEYFNLPAMELFFEAQKIHRENWQVNEVQISSLLNFKTGLCPEDCKYCPQSAHYNTGVEKEDFWDLEEILAIAKRAKEAGASRFCAAAGWRGPHPKDMDKLCYLVSEIKKMGLETCMSLSLLREGQAESLKEAGLDYYNHNIDTSEENYQNIITTRTFSDRIDTLEKVRNAGIKVCCGGIIGMGETIKDRASMLRTLANMNPHPESVPINLLIKIPGTPLENQPDIDKLDFIKTIAVARILMPKTYVRLSAGRKSLDREIQLLCFMVGANSIHYGEKLLVTKNVIPEEDQKMFEDFGLKAHYPTMA